MVRTSEVIISDSGVAWDFKKLKKKPFIKYNLDSKETSGEIITLRINQREREIINDLKKTLHYSQDAKVIKIGLILTKNVIQNIFSDEIMFKLCSENRTRTLTENVKES